MRSARFLPRFTIRLLAGALLVVSALLILARPVLAAGTVTVAERSPEEEDGRWKLKMTMNYGTTPHLAHIPMIFAFTPTAHYERALTDQSPEKPILNKIPLKGQQSINESMDVGFADASGKVFTTTKFDFVLRRDRGFESGEYDLKITRVSDGVQMGQTQKLILKGENPVIDRRAIVFAGEKKKEKKEEKKVEPEMEKAGDTADAPAEDPASTDTAEAPVETPPAVEPKQGGCGCRTTGAPPAGGAALAGLALAGLALGRRRSSVRGRAGQFRRAQ
ncbi:MYXO-CTERM sorting domain-containing protein [Chondromyces apiculatus]|uniref:MYXO-CTERM domain-containing protein n=1 Tax=Chondromyces apiculatus DSM 436 TaxID=1192034 RepID=A0A017T5Q8_9BACT|nr:MYXO-CTERM sorting domain-containing protein [Chondromyces apiculatus]EYF04362.1 Hypothetical protein CAP_4626 [Chondromyces apiculatus DSM 436]